jgi:hypothetical protein
MVTLEADVRHVRLQDVHPRNLAHASWYLSAVSEITALGNAGAGACLFHATPSTCAVSNQSRKYCLSKLGGFTPSV